MYQMGSDIPHMWEESDLVVDMARQSGDWVLLYLGYGVRGWAESRMGKHEEATRSMAHSQAFGRQHGSRLLFREQFGFASG